jgi:hypothetical protein
LALTISLEDFQAYLGTTETGDFITSALSAGHALVDAYQGEVEVPTQLHTQAVMICASEIYHRRSAPNGVAQFAAFDGQPVRVAKDPMNAVYPLLMRYVGFGV